MGLEAGGWLVGRDIKLEIDLAVEEAEVARTGTDSARVAA